MKSVMAKMAKMVALNSLAAGVLIFLSVAVSARAALEQKAQAFVLCKSQKEVRTIRILPDPSAKQPSGGCTITYSKGGIEEVMGVNRSLRNCQSILQGIQANLEASKWSCRNIHAAVVTTSSEVLGQ